MPGGMTFARARVSLGTLLFSVAGLAALSSCGDSDGDGARRDPAAGGSGGRAGATGWNQAGTAMNGGDSGDAGAEASGSGAGGSAGSGQTVGGASGSPTGGTGGAAGNGSAGGSALGLHALAATDLGTCALDASGTIHCWGLDPEVWEIPEGSFVELHGGGSDICAVRANRSVTCFSHPLGSPAMSQFPMGMVDELAVGTSTVCGIDAAGEAFCHAANTVLSLTPPDVDFLKVSVGNQFACGIREADDQIECWASESFGSCDYSPPASQLQAPSGTFAQISSAAYSSCALSSTGTIACWGLGEPGAAAPTECGAEALHGQSDPPGGVFRTVEAGTLNACGIRSDGTLACWGAGTTDDCVSGSVSCRQSRPPAGEFEQLALGLVHGCAMKANRTVECWGYESNGRTTPPDAFR